MNRERNERTMRENQFNDEKKEYIIRDMFPLRPWVNYSWNEDYVSMFDQFGFGMSRFCDENGYKKNILASGGNRLIFIKDKETKEYYAANRNYDNAAFDVFETKVGMGYQIITSSYQDLEVTFKLFVPRHGQCECWEITVKNLSDTEKKKELYAYAEMDTALSCHGYTKADFSNRINGIYASHEGYQIDTDRTGMFFASNQPVKSYETSNRRFRGVYETIQHPKGLLDETLSCMGTCFEALLGTAMQFDVILQPKEEKKLLFLLGSAKNMDDAEVLCSSLLSEGAFPEDFAAMLEEAEKFRNNVMVETPEEDINRRINIWLKRQMELGMQWGRLYGKGFRDLMQDITGFLSLAPEKARARILYATAYQRENGNPLRQWEPVEPVVYADGAVWLIYAVNAYLKETGDFAILKEEIPYYDSNQKDSLLAHCMQGFAYLFGNLGEHGLCLWLGGDWNDSMNACGIEGRGESVWLSEAAVKAGYELDEILRQAGQTEWCDEVLQKTETLRENILKHGMDNGRFIYGINDYGERIGSDDSKEGCIFLNPQTWAVLSGVVKGEDAVRIMDFVEDTLSCSYGYLQNYPSYSKLDDHIGRVTYFEQGVYENGSVYNHGVAFKAVADCVINDGNRALNTLKLILPSNPETANSGSEPYAVSNMYFGPSNPYRKGDAPLSWITGTSGWIFRCVTENILGVKAEYDGLKIEPNMPDGWEDASVVRIYRGARYEIHIRNKNQFGKYKLIVDGKEIEHNLVPVFEAGSIHTVVCER